MKILAITGRPRLGGNTNYLVARALGEARTLGRRMAERLIGKR